MAVDSFSCRGGRGGGSSTLFCLFLFLVLSLLLLATVARADAGDGSGAHRGPARVDDRQAPNAAERAMGAAAPGSASDRVRSWAKLATNLRPSESRSRPGAGKAVEEAAMRSLEAGTATAEEVARTAARAAEAAVEKTKEMVKRAVSSKSGDDADEL